MTPFSSCIHSVTVDHLRHSHLLTRFLWSGGRFLQLPHPQYCAGLGVAVSNSRQCPHKLLVASHLQGPTITLSDHTLQSWLCECPRGSTMPRSTTSPCVESGRTLVTYQRTSLSGPLPLLEVPTPEALGKSTCHRNNHHLLSVTTCIVESDSWRASLTEYCVCSSESYGLQR